MLSVSSQFDSDPDHPSNFYPSTEQFYQSITSPISNNSFKSIDDVLFEMHGITYH